MEQRVWHSELHCSSQGFSCWRCRAILPRPQRPRHDSTYSWLVRLRSSRPGVSFAGTMPPSLRSGQRHLAQFLVVCRIWPLCCARDNWLTPAAPSRERDTRRPDAPPCRSMSAPRRIVPLPPPPPCDGDRVAVKAAGAHTGATMPQPGRAWCEITRTLTTQWCRDADDATTPRRPPGQARPLPAMAAGPSSRLAKSSPDPPASPASAWPPGCHPTRPCHARCFAPGSRCCRAGADRRSPRPR